MDDKLTDCTLCDDCECGHSRCRHGNSARCLGVDPTTNHRCDCDVFVRIVKEED